MKNTENLNFKNTESIKVKEIERRRIHKPVSITSNIESLISLSVSQNFVPVTDDDGTFIGIIKRSDIINYCFEEMEKRKKLEIQQFSMYDEG